MITTIASSYAEKGPTQNIGNDYGKSLVSENLNGITRVSETSLVPPEFNQACTPIVRIV